MKFIKRIWILLFTIITVLFVGCGNSNGNNIPNDYDAHDITQPYLSAEAGLYSENDIFISVEDNNIEYEMQTNENANTDSNETQANASGNAYNATNRNHLPTASSVAPIASPWPAWLSFEAEQAVFSANSASITAVMTNRGSYAVSTPPDYFFEQYVDGQWQCVPAGIGMLDMPRFIGADGYRFFVYNRQHYDDHVMNYLNVNGFMPGTYRIIVHHVMANEIDHAQGVVTRNIVWQGSIWAEFEII